MDRRAFVHAGITAAVAFTAPPAIVGASRARHDLVLRGGVVIDGSGRPRFDADVAITGGRVTAVGPRLDGVGAREIDVRGHIVAPGFIDIHSHADGSLFDDPAMESVVRQGVTSVMIGADGSSRAPDGMRRLLESIDELRPGANVASAVGLGTVRGHIVGGSDRAATRSELARMTQLVETALQEGAVGASSGLEYTPGAFASPEELIALCRPLAARGRRLAYHTHLRNEDDRLLEALDEAIAVARGAGCALQVSHLKTQGPRNWNKLDDALARIDTARRNGLDAAFDRYPYEAYQTGLTNLFPVWSRDGGFDRFLARLDDPPVAERIRAETLAKIDLIGGWDNVQVTSVIAERDKPAEGRRLGAWAGERGVEPFEAAVALLRRSGGNVGMVGFAMSESNLERILQHEWSMVCSDGGALAVSGPARRGVPHPRGAGAFARVLGRYVRERGTLTLEQAVRKMSALPASRLRLADRGLLAPGQRADIAVFHPETVSDRATFENPFQYAVGVKATIVNGGVAFLDGERGPGTGRALRGAG